jgi:hypothetical protein
MAFASPVNSRGLPGGGRSPAKPVSAWPAPWYEGEKQGNTVKVASLASTIAQKDAELQ